MEPSSETVALGLQLAVAAGMTLLMTLVHGLGLIGITRALRLHGERLEEHDFNWGAIGLMSATALALFALHTAEIWIFALLYLGVDAIATLEEALFYSASAYATLGWAADYFPQEWRLVGAVEALVGFLLIGWSTAFIASKLGKLTPG